MSKPDLIVKLNSELRNSTHAITTHIGGQVGLAQFLCPSMLMNWHHRRWSAGISSCQLRCFTRYCGDAALKKYSCPGKLESSLQDLRVCTLRFSSRYAAATELVLLTSNLVGVTSLMRLPSYG